jgi:hypothetical protein
MPGVTPPPYLDGSLRKSSAQPLVDNLVSETGRTECVENRQTTAPSPLAHEICLSIKRSHKLNWILAIPLQVGVDVRFDHHTTLPARSTATLAAPIHL